MSDQEASTRGQDTPKPGESVSRGRLTLTLPEQQHKAITALAKVKGCEYGDLLQDRTISQLVEEYEALRKHFV